MARPGVQWTRDEHTLVCWQVSIDRVDRYIRSGWRVAIEAFGSRLPNHHLQPRVEEVVHTALVDALVKFVHTYSPQPGARDPLNRWLYTIIRRAIHREGKRWLAEELLPSIMSSSAEDATLGVQRELAAVIPPDKSISEDLLAWLVQSHPKPSDVLRKQRPEDIWPLIQDLVEELHKLSALYAESLLLLYHEELSHRDAAKRSQNRCAVGTMRARYRRAWNAMDDLLKRKYCR